MLHIGTGNHTNTREAITPGAIADGDGDAYLVALNNAIGAYGKAVYVRPMGEINNASNGYAGYSANGQPRDAAHSPRPSRRRLRGSTSFSTAARRLRSTRS